MPRIRRLTAALLIATLLGTGMPDPPEARADNTALIVIGSIVGYFGFVILATWLVLRNDDTGFSESSVSPFAAGMPSSVRPAPDSEMRFACISQRTGAALICW